MDDRIQALMNQREKKKTKQQKKTLTLVPKFKVKGNKTLYFFIFSKTNY